MGLGKGIHVHLIVRQQDISLEVLGPRPGVVLQSLDRQVGPFRSEQEHLLASRIEVTLVDPLQKRGRPQVDSRARAGDLNLGATAREFEQFAAEVPPVGRRAGDRSRDDRIVLRPVPHHRDLGVVAPGVVLVPSARTRAQFAGQDRRLGA